MTPDIILVRINEPIDSAAFQFLLRFSPPEKQQRILRQRVKQNADTMIVGGALVRHMLWKAFGIPSDARIAYGEFGKPYLTDYPHTHFNISHSGPYVACAVCSVPVGIDVQEIVSYHPDIANRVFNFCEREEIQNSSNVSVGFTKVWTQMESRIKAAGLRIGFKQDGNTFLNYNIISRFIGDAVISISYLNSAL